MAGAVIMATLANVTAAVATKPFARRLIAGEVPAAILTLVSPEAAEWFPDIAGYRIFRIPLSPGSLKRNAL